MWRACVLLGLALAGCGNQFTHVYLNPNPLTVTVGERGTVMMYAVIVGPGDPPHFLGSFVSEDESIARVVSTTACDEPTSCRAHVEGGAPGRTLLRVTAETDGDVEVREVDVFVNAAP